jgi:hypothetical protein
VDAEEEINAMDVINQNLHALAPKTLVITPLQILVITPLQILVITPLLPLARALWNQI